MDYRVAIHLIDAQKIFARIRQQLTVGRMINGFDAENFGRYLGVMFFGMTNQFKLGRARADDEDFSGIRDSLNNSVQIMFFSAAVTRASRAGFVMQVRVGGSGLDDFACAVIGVKMNDVCFLVVDPNDCMI